MGILNVGCQISGTPFCVIRSLSDLGEWWILESPGLSLASGFEHPASTLPTRFPAALGIGHGRPSA